MFLHTYLDFKRENIHIWREMFWVFWYPHKILSHFAWPTCLLTCPKILRQILIKYSPDLYQVLIYLNLTSDINWPTYLSTYNLHASDVAWATYLSAYSKIWHHMGMFPNRISKNVLTAIGLLISSTLTYLINEQLAYWSLIFFAPSARFDFWFYM